MFTSAYERLRLPYQIGIALLHLASRSLEERSSWPENQANGIGIGGWAPHLWLRINLAYVECLLKDKAVCQIEKVR